ncbi:MAG TPA: hypothetical protein VEB22_06410 [Phycisphaerales bacterium]|nr:hypothetical protein [Phycisphaerales bacterium]
MLHAGLDLSRRRLDVCLVDDAGEVVARTAAAPDADGLRHLAMRVRAGRVRAVIESMNGVRSLHDTLGEFGWEVLIADAQKVNGLAPFGVQERQDRRARAGGALEPRRGAGDLAARPAICSSRSSISARLTSTPLTRWCALDTALSYLPRKNP